MASEITYAEVRFKNEPKSSGTNSDSPAAPKENTTPLKSNPAFPKLLLGSLLILFLLLAILFFVAFVIIFNKYSQLLEEKTYKVSMKTSIHTNLKCVRNNSTMEEELPRFGRGSHLPGTNPALVADPTYLGLTGAPPLTAESSGSRVSAPLVATPCPQGRRNSGIFFQQFIQALDISSSLSWMPLPTLIKHLKPQCKAATWSFLIG
ncbi:C-type lectin domain family 4 member A isoform X4 [Marmota flaviventris]|uniref:C-type lectin domain family 4 member A isoform X4 n=1 Tax=Marmota flaviventris TaxID=93162 RepID=UPI003A8B13A9